MKVLYVSFHNPNSIGADKKVHQAISFFKDSGVSVSAILVSKYHKETKKQDGIQYVRLDEEPQLKKIFYRRYIRKSIDYVYQHKLHTIQYNLLDEYVQKEEFDYIYMRYPFASIGLKNFTKKYKGKVVFEHNTVELNEIKGGLEKNANLKYNFLCEKYSAKHIFKNAACGVSVTEEIRLHENQRAGFTYSDFVYKNPIKVSTFKPRKYIPSDKKRLSVLIGSYAEWHGLDIICDAIRENNKHKEYEFTYIGSVSPRVEEIFKGIEVDFVGKHQGEALVKYFENCDLTFGSLATFRFNVKELSSLKTREYIAMGVPMIIGCEDTAFGGMSQEVRPFVKVIDFAKEQDVLAQLDTFIAEVKKTVNHPELLHKFALEQLDYKPVFLNLIKHLENKR